MANKKKGETKHPTIVQKNSDEAEGKRAEKRNTRVKPIGILRQNVHILNTHIPQMWVEFFYQL
ncbi:hypothetical protein QUA81_04090 [Microcoleus sp. F6_B4]